MPPKKQQKNKPRVLSFERFFPSDIVAFVSDAGVNFTRPKKSPKLTSGQKKLLSRHAGENISSLPGVLQVHGKRVLIVKKPSCSEGGFLKADGLVTQKRGIPLTVRTADCLSIFLFDPEHHVISLLHAGWRGTQKKIVTQAIGLLEKNFKTNSRNLKVSFGPSIGPCCYEVGKEFKQYFPNDVKSRNGRLFFDLQAANKRELIRNGVLPKNIKTCTVCTSCNRNYFSYRRQGDQAGRMISFMMLKTNCAALHAKVGK